MRKLRQQLPWVNLHMELGIGCASWSFGDIRLALLSPFSKSFFYLLAFTPFPRLRVLQVARVNQHCGLAMTGMKRNARAINVVDIRGRDRRPNPCWSVLPDCEPGPDAEHWALAQRIVAFRRKVEEPGEEKSVLYKRPSLAAKRSQLDTNMPPLWSHAS
ncbi:MAG TPA: hypothetical protein VG297_04150 [Bryobacteraceae bacterium]|nr:hypothetical protein [Bryobacteraceae bacterium]